ncbi:GNAT family N-acetyltransferase [Methylovulum psychrotolerans]|uniref:GNAT family N-acetyltransferase n=1 Tax=Methylovulum psychrotolerans TaxID=1704499 RepID=UPI001BFF1D9F|nr:GNAT family N-acetyltransferase [Methylovulum psychrotolerans]MBT9100092.1 GNAT family N-acetyltransferase [Methylovulum psychrotolerans]
MLSSPLLLAADHQLEHFSCGTDSFDDWLKRRAYPNQLSGASRTYVVLDEARVVGYYCLASGALALNDAPSPVRRNMPNPIPVAILGRLAIDQSYQDKGLGVALLQDATLRTAQASGILGIRGLLVHALSIQAKAFYEHHGFIASPTQEMTLILSLNGKIQSR